MFSFVSKVLSLGLALFLGILFGLVPAAFVKAAFLELGLNGEVGYWVGFIPGVFFFLGKCHQLDKH